jgi:hypothetical protein
VRRGGLCAKKTYGIKAKVLLETPLGTCWEQIKNEKLTKIFVTF